MTKRRLRIQGWKRIFHPTDEPGGRIAGCELPACWAESAGNAVDRARPHTLAPFSVSGVSAGVGPAVCKAGDLLPNDGGGGDRADHIRGLVALRHDDGVRGDPAGAAVLVPGSRGEALRVLGRVFRRSADGLMSATFDGDGEVDTGAVGGGIAEGVGDFAGVVPVMMPTRLLEHPKSC